MTISTPTKSWTNQKSKILYQQSKILDSDPYQKKNRPNVKIKTKNPPKNPVVVPENFCHAQMKNTPKVQNFLRMCFGELK